jgi:DNA-binding winged helix-turn-helix (wHTH) protein/tetratricopeptide (TPR) repeat protein
MDMTCSTSCGGVAAYRIGHLVLDLHRRSIWRDGREVPLVGLTFDLLLALARRAPATVPVRDLMQEVWPGLVVGPDTLSQRIKLVRIALADNAGEPQYIANIRGRGYRLIAPVEALASKPACGPAVALPPAPAVAASSPVQMPASRWRKGMVLAAAGIAAAALLLAGRPHAETRDPQALAIYQRARVEVRSLVVTDSPDRALAMEEGLSTAIRRDPRFGRAYIERFNVRSLRFMYSWGDPEVLMAQMREDLDAARRLMPRSAEIAAAEGTMASFNQDYELALSRYDAAERAGLVDPHELIMRAGMMIQRGQMDDVLPIIERAIRLPESSARNLLLRGVVQGYLRRPSDAIGSFRQAAAVDERAASTADSLIGYTRHQFSGRQSSVPPQSLEGLLARGEVEAARMLASTQPERVPGSFDGGILIPVGVGAMPLRALSLGRVALMTNDSAGAIRAGRAVAAFVGGERETRYNKWYLKNLGATALLLVGDKASAIQAAREALQLAPRSASAINWTLAAARAATTLAWAGADDEALDLLEELADSTPGLPPTAISRSLELGMSLGGNPRYQALVRKLDARMALTKL